VYIQTDIWRFTLFTALGFGSNACTKDGAAPTPARSSEAAASQPKPKESALDAPPTSWVSKCGDSQLAAIVHLHPAWGSTRVSTDA
jgi:hypothetical protein